MGVGGTIFGYYMVNRKTLVLTARQALVLDEGITIPKGVRLVHDAFYTEGFESLILYVNVPSSDVDKYFESQEVDGAFLTIPYWVR